MLIIDRQCAKFDKRGKIGNFAPRYFLNFNEFLGKIENFLTWHDLSHWIARSIADISRDTEGINEEVKGRLVKHLRSI